MANTIQWSIELGMGVKEIDDQHRHLIDIANTLIDAVADKAQQADVDTIIGKLRAYTVAHFAAEEKLMQEAKYPKLGHHANEHRKLKDDVKQFQRELYRGKTPTAGKVLGFLKIWLLDHILSFDREFARYLKEEKSGKKVVEV